MGFRISFESSRVRCIGLEKEGACCVFEYIIGFDKQQVGGGRALRKYRSLPSDVRNFKQLQVIIIFLNSLRRQLIPRIMLAKKGP